MIENFRLKNSTNKNFETNKEFLQRFGQISTLTNRKTDLPVTPLFANRTENETNRFNEIRREFRDDVVQILLNSFQTTSKDEQREEIENINENLLPIFHSEFSIESSRSNSLQLPIRIENEEKSSSIEKSKIVRRKKNVFFFEFFTMIFLHLFRTFCPKSSKMFDQTRRKSIRTFFVRFWSIKKMRRSTKVLFWSK